MAIDPSLAARRELAAAIAARTEAEAAVSNVARAIEATTEQKFQASVRKFKLAEEAAEARRAGRGAAADHADALIRQYAGGPMADAPVAAPARDFDAELAGIAAESDRLGAALEVMSTRASDADFKLGLARGKVSDAARAVIAHSHAATAAIGEFNAAIERALAASAVLNALARSDPGRFNAVLARAPLVPPGARVAPWSDFEGARAPAAEWLKTLDGLTRDATTALPGERPVKL